MHRSRDFNNPGVPQQDHHKAKRYMAHHHKHDAQDQNGQHLTSDSQWAESCMAWTAVACSHVGSAGALKPCPFPPAFISS